MLDQEERWRDYIARYSSVDATGGFDERDLRTVILRRNLVDANGGVGGGVDGLDEQRYERFMAAKNEEGLVLRVAVENYHVYFQPGTSEGFFEEGKLREDNVEEAVKARETRDGAVKETLLKSNEGMKDLGAEEVVKRDAEFDALVSGAEVKVDGMEVDA